MLADVTLIAASGLFGPTVDDLFRIAIFVVGVLNVLAVTIALILLRRYLRLLLDTEHYAREARNRLERDMTTMARAMASLEGEIAQLQLDRTSGSSPGSAGPQNSS
jgi:hypothetical protein